jgi:hypothetical protein
VLGVGVNTAAAVCRYKWKYHVCRLKRSHWALWSCSQWFCLPTVGSSEQIYFKRSILSRLIKQTFTVPDFARTKRPPCSDPGRKDRYCLTHFAAICLNSEQCYVLWWGDFVCSLWTGGWKYSERFEFVCVCVCACVRACVCIIYVFVYVCTYVCMYVCMYLCMCVFSVDVHSLCYAPDSQPTIFTQNLTNFCNVLFNFACIWPS